MPENLSPIEFSKKLTDDRPFAWAARIAIIGFSLAGSLALWVMNDKLSDLKSLRSDVDDLKTKATSLADTQKQDHQLVMELYRALVDGSILKK